MLNHSEKFVIIQKSYLFIETMNKKNPVLNDSQGFHKQPVKI